MTMVSVSFYQIMLAIKHPDGPRHKMVVNKTSQQIPTRKLQPTRQTPMVSTLYSHRPILQKKCKALLVSFNPTTPILLQPVRETFEKKRNEKLRTACPIGITILICCSFTLYKQQLYWDNKLSTLNIRTCTLIQFITTTQRHGPIISIAMPCICLILIILIIDQPCREGVK